MGGLVFLWVVVCVAVLGGVACSTGARLSKAKGKVLFPDLSARTDFIDCSIDYAHVHAGEDIVFRYSIPLHVLEKFEIERVVVYMQNGQSSAIKLDKKVLFFTHSSAIDHASQTLYGETVFTAPGVGSAVKIGMYETEDDVTPIIELGSVKVLTDEEMALVNSNRERAERTEQEAIDCKSKYQFFTKGGRLEDKEMAAKVLKECGMVVVHNVLPTSQVESLKSDIMSYVCTYQEKSKVSLAQDCKTRPKWHGSIIPVMSVNHEKRFEFVTPFEGAFGEKYSWANPSAMDLLSEVLLPSYVIESIGGFNAMPGASNQNWHVDNEHQLFSEVPQHPPYCLTVSIPLVDCNTVSGCTEFSFRSHHCMDVDSDGVRLPGCDNNKDIWPDVKAGSAIIYDPRIIHRGRENKGKTDRPMIHNSYCHPWYKDEGNGRGESVVVKNMLKLGRPTAESEALYNKNEEEADRLAVDDLLLKMYSMYALEKNGDPPITESYEGTSTGIELVKKRMADSNEL